MQFQNVPIGKVESKFLKLRKQLERKQKEKLCVLRDIINACLRSDCSVFAFHCT